MKIDDLIQISKADLLRLEADANFLQCLEACGVDNLDGYDDTVSMFTDLD